MASVLVRLDMTLESALQRISELETRLEFQDDTIAQLNAALVAQQKKLFDLEKTLQLLAQQLREQTPDAPLSIEPPPPHY